MRVLKLRDYWDKNDDNLVMNNRFTKQGLSAYWKSLDASFKFNLKKREDFIIRHQFQALKSRSDEQGTCKKDLVMKPGREDYQAVFSEDSTDEMDAMLQFFSQNRSQGGNRFHWKNKDYRRPSDNTRFLLPHLKNFKNAMSRR